MITPMVYQLGEDGGGLRPDPPLRFPLGRVMATPGALETMARCGIDGHGLLRRHSRGDWGNLDAHDKAANDFAVGHGLRILSAYGAPDDPDCLWVITEADRSVTTILRPEEY